LTNQLIVEGKMRRKAVKHHSITRSPPKHL